MIKMKAVGIVSALLVCSVAMAQVDMTFSGVGNWTDPNLWSTGSVPGDVNLANYANISDMNTICTVNTDTGAFAGGQARMQIDGGATLVLEDGGVIAATSWTRVGISGVGILQQTGGVFAIQNDKIGIGDKSGGEGFWIMSGGTMTYDGDRGDIAVGSREGTGTLTIIGTAPVIDMEELIVCERDGSAGTVEFVLEADGVSPITVIKTTIDAKGDTTASALVVSANAAPPLADILLVDVTGGNASNEFDTINGAEAVEGAEVVIRGGGVENTYTLTYVGGDGNDIVLVYQSTAVVIGDFEDGLDGWTGVSWDGNPELTVGTAGATTGDACLDVNVTGGYWQLEYDGPNLDLREATAIEMDVTLLVDDFPADTWIKVGDKVSINGDDLSGGWQEVTLAGQGQSIDRLTGEATSADWGTWGGAVDQYRTITYDISGLDLSAKHLTAYFQVFISIQGAGIHHIDNIRIIGAKVCPTVIWVSDNKGYGDIEPNVPGDNGWVELLELEGYVVDYRNEGEYVDGEQYWRTLDANKVAELEAADLIIISRNADSGSYASVADNEPNQWNAVTTPILNLNGYMARSNKWGWLNTTGTTRAAESMLTLVDPNHPIFAGIVTDANDQVAVLSDQYNVDWASATDAGNGELLATGAGADLVSIAIWEAGEAYFEGGAAIAGGPRMLFTAGTGSKNSGDNYAPDGMYNLTSEGEVMFLNAVDYLVP